MSVNDSVPVFSATLPAVWATPHAFHRRLVKKGKQRRPFTQLVIRSHPD